GGPWSTGAARQAARGGLRIGAGLVTVMSPREAAAVNAAHLEAVMLRPFDDAEQLGRLVETSDVVLIGPGAGVDEATQANVLSVGRTGAALVLDADALTVFRHDPDALFATLDRDDVLTPHEGEFERIFPGLLARGDREAAALEAAARADAVVLLKGSETVIAAPDGRLAVNAPASPWLATAGSGDVLAGFLGGLMAQGMDSFEAACAAAWIHAACAEAFGPGLVSEDLPDLVPAVLRRLPTA
ncbi:MAG: NAD(P)H-hydrate dehydratase, partial [Pseudomonadota bacterium]|nr:NAD(P)H-hydrate dehydratase [Pseudomonadota bacterium]